MLGFKKAAIALSASAVTALSLALPALAATTPRSTTIWQTTGDTGVVDVIPYVKADKKGLFVDFESRNFKNVDYIYFNLNYNTNEEGTKRGVEGYFYPRISELKPYGGAQYIRKEFTFGTCSKNVCKYDRGVRDVKLTVKTHMAIGKVASYTKVLTIAY